MAEERVQRRLAAILVADVVGYSRLIEADEEDTRARLRSLLAELIEPRIAADGGRIVKTTGDGILVEFPSAVDAVRNALVIQGAMRERNRDVAEDRKIEFRVGINLGDVIVEGDDIHGDGVNVAARLEGMCGPGEVYVSGSVHDQVAGKLTAAFDNLGEHIVKNIAKHVQIYRVRADIDESTSEVEAVTSLPLPDKPSIAVLPFENMSGDPEQEYFADGIAEDILTGLSRFRWFFVIARNSTFTYKGRAVDVKKAARELGVQYVLEGSVRKAANRLRITAQLIDALTGRHVWAERYDRDLEDIFAVQDEITQSIVSSVAPEFLSAEIQRVQRKEVRNLDAWGCFVRANAHHSRFTEQDVTEAQRLLGMAIELDPAHAQAFCLLAFTHLLRVQFGWSNSPDRSIQEAAKAAEIAAVIDDRDAWAHTALGMVDLISRRYDDAIRRLEGAITLNPNLANAHGGLGQALALSGEFESADGHIQRAIRLSPMDPFLVYWFAHLGLAAFVAERYEDAVEWAAKTIHQNPRFPGGHRLIAASFGQLGKKREARASVEELLRLIPGMRPDDVRKQVPFRKTADMERYVQGLRKAGLPD